MTTTTEIIKAFRQGIVAEGGNCASIAVIKAAIDVFGVGKVFEHKKPAKNTR